MIDKKLIPVAGLKKEPFSGSHNGMRYFFRGDDGKSSTTFTVFVYPEPWCFEQTPEEKIKSASFPLTEAGMDQAITWLWKCFNENRSEWLNASKEMMHIVLGSAKNFPV